MDRRKLLQLGAGAFALAAAPAGVAAAAPAPKKLNLGAYSRTLHWLRSPEQVAQAVREIGNTTIDLTVRPYPGHVLPEKAKTDFVPFVESLRRNGVVVDCMAADIADANTPYVEEMLDAAARAGVKAHWWRGYNLDNAKPYQPQIDDFKRRTEGLAKLEEKYGTKAIYHPGGAFSGGFTDLLDLCRQFDPKHIAIQYDTGNLGQFSPQNMVTQLRVAGPYIGGFVYKDFVIEKAAPGAPPAFAGAPPRPAGAPPAGGPAGGGGGGGGGGPGGGFQANNGFRSRQVPVGTGVINLQAIARTLKEIGFDGPMECEPEWPELGGANQGLDKLTISREECIALLKRDFTTVQASLVAEGLA